MVSWWKLQKQRVYNFLNPFMLWVHLGLFYSWKSSIVDNIVKGVMGMVLNSISMSNISFKMLQLKDITKRVKASLGTTGMNYKLSSLFPHINDRVARKHTPPYFLFN